MNVTKYSLRGALFKLACRLCESAQISDWTLPRDWGCIDWVDTDPATARAEIQSMVADGTLAWCGYHEPTRDGETGLGWIAGTEGHSVPSLRFAAAAPHELAAIHIADPETLARADKASTADALDRLLAAIKNEKPGRVAELIPVAKRALAEGAEASATSARRKAFRPLHEAARLNDPTILRMLMPSFDIDARDRDGATPISIATRAGQAKCVRALLDAGANARLPDDALRTPLMISCARDYPRELIDALLPASDPDARDALGRSALWLSADAKRLNAVEALLPLCDIDAADTQGATPLMMAVQCNASDRLTRHEDRLATETTRALIAARPALDARDREGRTALMLALGWRENGGIGDVVDQVVEDLVAAGASVDGVYPNGDSLLTHCTRHDLLICAAALGPLCDARHRGESGDTALMHFAMRGTIHGVRAILERSDADARDENGRSALFAAAWGLDDDDLSKRHGATLCALALLPHCDINARDFEGETPFNLLIDTESYELFDIALPRARLEWSGDLGRSPFEAAAMAEDPHSFDALLPRCDPRFADVSGKTALMLAAINDRVHQTRALIPLSEVDRQCSLGMTALMWACAERSSGAIEQLIEHADPSPRNIDGKSAAVLARDAGLHEIAARLDERYASRERGALAVASARPTRAKAAETRRL